MATPELRHFERAAQEIAAHGDNDTLPFDLDVKFVGQKANELAAIAFGFYSELKAGTPKENRTRLHGLRVYSERLIAPSSTNGFRVVTKIHPFWNIYLNGLAIAIAETLEPLRDEHAHSYRLLPHGEEKLFDPNRSWRAFKEATVQHANEAGTEAVIVQTDISSFYDHVSHHHLEHFINDLGGESAVMASQIDALLGRFSGKRSFGLPVGGQASRVFSELFLSYVDNALSAAGVSWHRYVDDYILIAADTSDAYRVLGTLAQILADYGLSLNKSKTIFLTSKHYQDYVRAQLGDNDEEAEKLRRIDLKFDPYSDEPDIDYESLKGIVESLDVRRLLNRELEKSLPDNFLVAQIGRTMRLHSPGVASEIATTLLMPANLHAFRSSFSTIMRGIAHLRSDATFANIHGRIDILLDAVPVTSGHLLQVDTNRLHYLRCLRFQATPERRRYIKTLFDGRGSDVIQRACIECWRSWKDSIAFNFLRNRWDQMSPDCQRIFWLATFSFGNQGKSVRRQFEPSLRQGWALGVEVPLDKKKDKDKLEAHPRGAEPRFSTLYESWALEMNDAG
ncbi:MULTISPECIES: RNA-directed DNA polymerase [unclassified Marinobacter]|uniref:RNA-directed DNA polymerase n=1 Tax=unclassified Marinobacter TaxID=83889 RepID=UPI0020100E05|nr:MULTISPECIES: RNA-directed DNA polymerase [unclassified Marinobacter]UQG57888.1 RNA-directed DNA polymerase [Marinobacter sp. M4C]UQG66692.1 RNA-directed DNA polymerase [Marinobacter sp. M2C]UQG70972.1 RNA-directed DNA polymerase [Marinobacter sp. M1C]